MAMIFHNRRLCPPQSQTRSLSLLPLLLLVCSLVLLGYVGASTTSAHVDSSSNHFHRQLRQDTATTTTTTGTSSTIKNVPSSSTARTVSISTTTNRKHMHIALHRHVLQSNNQRADTENSNSRQLQDAADYFQDMDIESMEEGAIAVLLLLLLLCFLCCCCCSMCCGGRRGGGGGGCGLTDILAMFCCYEMFCDDNPGVCGFVPMDGEMC